ncbi:prostate-specific antigen isoform 3 preproprotein [Daubentonia madagascariensis]|uniref:Prostate-specific antigen isoform 3 preproprotein n=1 Tax=Daubentonia madagascariensis TaxID=31869 RepID=A0ABD2D8C9_DAUMA
MWFLVFSLTLSLGWTGAAPLIQPRVVGGWECEQHSQPWQAAVIHRGIAQCGGVLVDPKWVLTAAHCINDNSQVWLGRHSLLKHEDTGQLVKVSRSFPHPLYNMSLLKLRVLGPEDDSSHDIMLLHLSDPANITDAVKVLDLPTQEPELGSTCYASGWGSIRAKKFLRPKTLQCVDLKLLSNDKCKRAYSEKVTEFMLCAGQWNGKKDTCTWVIQISEVTLPRPCSEPSMAPWCPGEGGV